MIPKHHPAKFYVILFLLSFSMNTGFAILWPRTGGDWDSYGTVAENLYQGHGVSLSHSEPYEPAFGGNSFPGYPAFIALVWGLFGKSDLAVRLAQSLLFAGCAILFAYHAGRFFRDDRIGLVTGLLIAVSPLTIAWSRSLQAESLSLASVMAFYAFLMLSLIRNRLSILGISLSIIAAIYLRVDGILLFVPLLSLFLFGDLRKKDWIKRCALVLILVAAGTGAWMVRCHLVGMKNILPPSMLVISQDREVYPPPYGYLMWGWTWMSKEYERGGWGFPVTRAKYDAIYIPPAAFDGPDEKERVERLLAELEGYTDQAFPEHIDQQFLALAKERMREHPLRVFLILPLERSWALWFHPGSSGGWPIELDQLSYEDRTQFEKGGYVSGGLHLLKKYPFKIIGKAVIFSSTLILYALSVAGVILLLRSKQRILTTVILSYVIIRTLFYGFTNNIESRYMSQVLPLLMLISSYAVVVVYDKFRKRTKNRSSAAGDDITGGIPGADLEGWGVLRLHQYS